MRKRMRRVWLSLSSRLVPRAQAVRVRKKERIASGECGVGSGCRGEEDEGNKVEVGRVGRGHRQVQARRRRSEDGGTERVITKESPPHSTKSRRPADQPDRPYRYALPNGARL